MPSPHYILPIAMGACLAIASPHPQAWAQESGASEASLTAQTSKEIYPPEFFNQFQPRTAADMIERVPGFTISGQGGNGRGFGQANLNVLINGRRPSSKSSGANEILGRIPADNVVQIEILDGASLDIPGLSGQVANIITKKATKLSGNWGYSARSEQGTEPQLLEGNASIAGSRGNLDFVVSVDLGQFTLSENGVEQFFDGNGVQTQDRLEDINFRINRPNADVNLTWEPDNGHVANLNLSTSLGNRNSSIIEDFTVLSGDELSGQSQSFSGEDEWIYEIGGDYALPLGPGTLKIIALNRFENSVSDNRFVDILDGEIPTLSLFENDQDEGELIGRLEYNFKPAPKQDLQISAEGALNFLESDTLFFETGDTENELDSVRVEEERAEGNLTHSWNISDKVSFQTSIGAEYSR